MRWIPVGGKEGWRQASVPAHLTTTDCCSGQETEGKSRTGDREVFELLQPTSCAAQQRRRTLGALPLGSMSKRVSARMRTYVSIAPGRRLGSQGKDTRTLYKRQTDRQTACPAKGSRG